LKAHYSKRNDKKIGEEFHIKQNNNLSELYITSEDTVSIQDDMKQDSEGVGSTAQGGTLRKKTSEMPLCCKSTDKPHEYIEDTENDSSLTKEEIHSLKYAIKKGYTSNSDIIALLNKVLEILNIIKTQLILNYNLAKITNKAICGLSF